MHAADTRVTSTIFAHHGLGCKSYQSCGNFLVAFSGKLGGKFAVKNADCKLLQDLRKIWQKLTKFRSTSKMLSLR